MDHLHNLEQGQRVHYLANLGGLVVLAKLDHLSPDLLLGIFIEISRKIPHLTTARLTELKTVGREKLSSRNSEKRAFKSWQRAKQTERFDLTHTQIQRLIIRLGKKVPVLPKDLSSELRRLLGELLDG